MSLALAVSLLLQASSEQNPAAGIRWIESYADELRSGAQCRYRLHGEKAMLFKLDDPKRFIVVLQGRKGDNAAPALIHIRPDGIYEFHANGGIAVQLGYARLTDYLRTKPQIRLTANSLPAFLRRRNAPPCPWAGFTSDVYGKGKGPPE
jgi:hypothetical protein